MIFELLELPTTRIFQVPCGFGGSPGADFTPGTGPVVNCWKLSVFQKAPCGAPPMLEPRVAMRLLRYFCTSAYEFRDTVVVMAALSFGWIALAKGKHGHCTG